MCRLYKTKSSYVGRTVFLAVVLLICAAFSASFNTGLAVLFSVLYGICIGYIGYALSKTKVQNESK